MSDSAANAAPSDVEQIKNRSRYLRGSVLEGLSDRLTGGISDDDKQLTKFHGIYQQDDRDIRERRLKKKLEPAHSFMVRVRVPGGVCTPRQWLQMDRLARRIGGGSIRLTTRQAVQFHGILKTDLQDLVTEVCEVDMDTIAACGDVNRNVMCGVAPDATGVRGDVFATARAISDHLTPQTGAYREIWIDRKRVHASGGDDVPAEDEPIYGKTYLPRKFKIAIALPPDNDVDVFAHDIGLIAIEENGRLAGYNIAVGGGMGMTHGMEETYPQLGRVIGFCTPDEVVHITEKIVTIQRDFGDRSNRKHARMKYTIDDRGIDWFVGELTERVGQPLAPPRPFAFVRSGDRYGWHRDPDGTWQLTLFIENGRLRDSENRMLLTGMHALAETHQGEFRLTANQNLIIAGVGSEEEKARIDGLAREYGLHPEGISSLRRNAMACVAFPTCPLAMAESERYLPDLITRIEDIMNELGIGDEEITLRMTGCPNGCARPYLGEIGFVGKAPGKYNLYLGAGFSGDRLNVLYRENIGEEEILRTLRSLLERYAEHRDPGEHFSDFLVREDVVAAVTDGRLFHKAAHTA